KDRARRHTELPLEQAREVRLVGEAIAERDVRQARAGLFEESIRSLESKREDVLMRRTADRPPEGSHEVRRTQSCLARQLIDRDAFVESRIDELEDALPNHRRQSTAQSRNARFG